MSGPALLAIGGVVLVILLSLKSNASAYAPVMRETILERSKFVLNASAKYGIPQARIYAIIFQESRNNASALGSAGERGLMQVMEGAVIDWNRHFPAPKTWLGIPTGYTFEDMLDPEQNIDVGTGYLSIQRDALGGDLDAATQAYNVGLSNFVLDRSRGSAYLASVKNFESQFNSLL